MERKNNSLQEIAEIFLQKDHFTLIGHSIPDGDCIGSLLALHMVLKTLGKKSNILLKDAVPSQYAFLASSSEVQNEESLPVLYENVVFLDCGEASRSGLELSKILTAQTALILNIDHHETNDYFGHLNYVDASAAATAEILAELIPMLKVAISSEVAEALYMALIMDTGNFQYSSTTSRTFRIAAELLECGADINRIRIAMFESKDEREIRMISAALQHMERSQDGKIAWMHFTLQEAQALHAENFHPEGLVNILRSIQGVEVAVFFREMEEKLTKMAFRSKSTVDVSQIAAHFGGGGHIQASGARFSGTLQQAIHAVIPYIKEVLETK